MKTKLCFIIVLVFFTNTLFANNDVRLKAFKESVDAESIGNYEEAIEKIKSIYNSNRNDYLVNLRLGWLNYLSKNYDESIKFYNEAVRLSDKSAEAYLGLTLPVSAKEDWDRVSDIYQKILDRDEFNYTANLNLGKIYFNNKNYLNAKILLEKIISSYPSDDEANLYLGWTYYYLGDSTKAKVFFENALINNQNSDSAIEGLNLTR